MRASPLHNKFAALGATFAAQHGREIVARIADRPAEYAAVREVVGLTDFSFVQKFRVPEATGLDFLDSLVAGNVPRIRFGRVLHTFLSNDDGLLLADCYIANNDQEFIFLCESIVPDAEILRILDAAGLKAAGAEDLTETHVLLGIDGVRAWEVVKEAFGADVLGLPYLSVEVYPFEGTSVYLFRAGKTAEFGYQLLAPVAVAEALFDKLHGLAQKSGGRCCGFDVHNDLRLEGRFFNIHAEGARVRDPLVLGLQWMVDFEKEKFGGAAAINRRRAEGLNQKIVGVAVEPGNRELAVGAKIIEGGQVIGEVVADCFSGVLNRQIGLAVLPVAWAYSGLTFRLESGEPVQTISMPPIMPKSLKVKLDEV
ncbi:MAG: glycine cleavage T C-terminal barrel domain-containing protein [Verrucomicrobiia bacterium]